jgi:hypothetical protein
MVQRRHRPDEVEALILRRKRHRIALNELIRPSADPAPLARARVSRSASIATTSRLRSAGSRANNPSRIPHPARVGGYSGPRAAEHRDSECRGSTPPSAPLSPIWRRHNAF